MHPVFFKLQTQTTKMMIIFFKSLVKLFLNHVLVWEWLRPRLQTLHSRTLMGGQCKMGLCCKADWVLLTCWGMWREPLSLRAPCTLSPSGRATPSHQVALLRILIHILLETCEKASQMLCYLFFRSCGKNYSIHT